MLLQISQKYSCILIILLTCTSLVFGQQVDSKLQREILRADSLLKQKDFNLASEAYQTLSQRLPNEPIYPYKSALCYFYSKRYYTQAIEIFENLLKKYPEEKLPTELHYYLGCAYHFRANQYRENPNAKENDFLLAIQQFITYNELMDNKPGKIADLEKKIKACENALKASQTPNTALDLKLLPFPYNSSFDDYAPVFSNDGSSLFFTSDRLEDSFHSVLGDDYLVIPDSLKNKAQLLYEMQKGDQPKEWFGPFKTGIEDKVIQALDLTRDGKQLLIYKGTDQETGDLYVVQLKRNKWSSSPHKLPAPINSQHIEKGGCFASDGKVIFFASNRPGGYGGFDLYKSYQTGRDSWSEPINLGPVVNSPDDEVNPTMHTDNKTLYFSSNSSKSIGGFDIFRTKESGAGWTEPENLGFPLNSTFDDDYFVQSPDKSVSFLASNRVTKDNLGLGGYDLISIHYQRQPVAMAMVKGNMVAKLNHTTLPLELEVIDAQSNEQQSYVFNPDTLSGRYFMLVQPGRSYSMDIRLGHSLLRNLQINIPENTYMYELNQEFNIQQRELHGTMIGKVEVGKSNFSIIQLDKSGDQLSAHQRYDGLEELIQYIIERTDSTVLSKISGLEKDIFKPSSSTQKDPETYYNRMFDLLDKYFEDPERYPISKLEEPLSGNTSPYIMLDPQPIRTTVQFEKQSNQLNDESIRALTKITDFVKVLPKLKVEILHVNATNQPLNSQRVQSIKQWLLQQGIIGKELILTELKDVPVGYFEVVFHF
ncbi:hypothetical protein AAG747_18440 [Rapidithrix thailandica]|uniref:Uncharacterized protein n=1 Tax=Rapidithrix thailandica TaxID=413964 RepID=A0AAW9S3Y4_9BACT